MQPVPVQELALVERLVEQWAWIPDAPLYEVSSLGRVRRDRYPVASWPNHKGYHLVSLEIDGMPRLRYVHRLVLQAFVGPGPRRVANHLNGRKDDNRRENLEWTTPAGNARHARQLQRRAWGFRSLFDPLEPA